MSSSPLFGAIADDYTGGSDLAGMLCEQGVRTVQTFGPQPAALLTSMAGRYQAAVICLKTRSIPREEACRMSIEALGNLRALGVAQVQFKYCSTFDSTAEGNIGPVTDALMDAIGTDFTVAIPALPVNGRTQYLGHLFVGGQLLSDSPMRTHPLNPMTDSNLVRHLQSQTRRKVGLIAFPVVERGAGAVLEEMDRLRAEGIGIALADCLSDAHLETLAEASAHLPLITGGSGPGMKLPAVWKRRGRLEIEAGRGSAAVGGSPGVLVLAGSCSAATLRQLRVLSESGCRVEALDCGRLMNASSMQFELDRLVGEARAELASRRRFAIASSAPPERRRAGGPELASAIEAVFGELARRMVEAGLRRLIVAGGETSGAVINALGVPAVEVLEILDPGVPALRSLTDPPLALALKSGNFGSADFFVKGIGYLEESC